MLLKKYPATIFMAATLLITISQIFLGPSERIPGGLVPLICFLPMAFFFIERRFAETSALEARIQQLEEKLNQQRSM